MGSIQSHFFQVAEIKIKNEDIRHGLRITRLSSNINIRFQIDPNAREIEPFRFASQSTEPDRLPKAKAVLLGSIVLRRYRDIRRREVYGCCTRMRMRGIAYRWEGGMMAKVRR